VNILELLKAVIIGVVEGITEWLPISSTGHMILVDEFIQLDVSPAFWELFLVVIQLGAILAVIVLYFQRLNPFTRKKTPIERRDTLRLWAKVIVGCLPAAIIGILLDDWAEEHFFNALTVAVALVVYGIAFIVVEHVHGRAGTARVVGAHSKQTIAQKNAQDKRAASQNLISQRPQKTRGRLSNQSSARTDDLSFIRALGIGVFQCLAIIPGTSRSGSTILGGLILGVSRQTATEFSFFLAIPVMFGWSLLKAVKVLVLDHLTLSPTEIGVLTVGILVAFAVSVVSIRFLLGFIKKHSFAAFGWYRIALGVIVVAYFVLTGQLFA
jgi:undecaprenyl-diphosphatase